MPSWNIHTAHVERLLREEEPAALGIRDTNAFLFGNFVPDVYVGYMVKPTSKKIPYRETHFADPNFVPAPRYMEFWKRYGWPSNEGGIVSDVVLGAWCHLMADHVYNAHTNAFLAKNGIRPGEQTRIRKQGDFNAYGHTLWISIEPHVDAELIAQCAAFPQYSVEEEDVRRAVDVACGIVEENQRDHLVRQPAYSMLDAGFFRTAADETDELMRRCLRGYAEGTTDDRAGSV